MIRFQMVKRRFQKASVEQDALIQDYQKRARLVNVLKIHKCMILHSRIVFIFVGLFLFF